jgi:hypothetical protein
MRHHSSVSNQYKKPIMLSPLRTKILNK